MLVIAPAAGDFRSNRRKMYDKQEVAIKVVAKVEAMQVAIGIQFFKLFLVWHSF